MNKQQHKRYVLGISAFYHDSAAAIVQGGKIIAAAQEERFTRKKNDARFPSNAVDYCLRQTGLSINELDAVVFYDKPLLKFERLHETYHAFSPAGWLSFITSMPVWLKQKIFLKRTIRKELLKVQPYDTKKLLLLFTEHHLSHAASAFYPSAFNEAAIVTMDGVGEWETVSISQGFGEKIKSLRELHFPHSPGLLYSAFTYYLGFKVNSGEYKLMGLAPYCSRNNPQVETCIKRIKENLVKIRDDGSLWLNQSYFNYSTGLSMVKEKKWEELFGFAKKKPEESFSYNLICLAMAAQLITEEIVIKTAAEAGRLTGSKNLCLAGGVALNCVANGQLADKMLFDKIFIQPVAGDAGGALGAALAASHIYFGQERIVNDVADGMQGSFLGPDFTNSYIKKFLLKQKIDAVYFDDFNQLAAETASLLASGNVVGWFSGRMEFGPRALGGRSILADARNADLQNGLNHKIKFREGFRPFAPAVMEEYAEQYFEGGSTLSPYMLRVTKVKRERRFALPGEFELKTIEEKRDFVKSDIPAVTHADYSARVQVVNQKTNPAFWSLLNEFNKQTGCPVLINTSFNVRGEPMVCSPDDALRCFMSSGIDYLVMGNFMLSKAHLINAGHKTTRAEIAVDAD